MKSTLMRQSKYFFILFGLLCIDTYFVLVYSTWSDREIRTLLTKLYELPLSYAIVDYFESLLINCTQNLEIQGVPTPLYERYVDSRLVSNL